MTPAAIRILDQPGDLGWVVMAHGELYAAEYGFNVEFEQQVLGIVADFSRTHDPARESAWIAWLDARRVGCVFLIRENDDTARLRILLVHPDARGHRLGTRLVQACIEFAQHAGYRRIVLWTNEPLAAARQIYLAAGFRLVSENTHHSYGVELLGQDYELELTGVDTASIAARDR